MGSFSCPKRVSNLRNIVHWSQEPRSGLRVDFWTGLTNLKGCLQAVDTVGNGISLYS